jgi:hypothetical protein
MRTSLRQAQCICPRRKNFDGGDRCASSHHSGALETGVRRKSSLRAAKPRKSRTFLGDAQKCELSGSGWWRTQSVRTGLRRVFPINREKNRDGREMPSAGITAFGPIAAGLRGF